MVPPHTISPVKSPIEIDESMIEASHGGTFGIDTKYATIHPFFSTFLKTKQNVMNEALETA